MGIIEYLELSERTLAAARHHPGVLQTEKAIEVIANALSVNKPLLLCGNGGGASDAKHITGNWWDGSCKSGARSTASALPRTLPCSLPGQTITPMTRYFLDRWKPTGRWVGALLGISTSGNSKNVIEAFKCAREMGVATIALTGEGGGKLASLSDVLIDVPSRSTPLIQQVHICLYHYICEKVEERLSASS